MAYLPNYQYDIFISYAHVDNRRDEEKWVDQFSKSLKSCLAEQIGRDEVVAIWRDERLSGNEILHSSIVEACRNSAILICITSPGYMESEWCQKEYDAFCSANQGQHPPIHGNSSRVFIVRLREPSSREHKANFEKKFGQLLGYKLYDPSSGSMLWPKPPNDSDTRYRDLIEELAKDIRTLLENMGGKTMRDEKPDLNQLEINPADLYSCSLHEILQQAKKRLIISAHTLNKFSYDPNNPDDPELLFALRELLRRGVRVTLITLNHKSKYAQAHAPYHVLESETPAKNPGEQSLVIPDKLAEDQLLESESPAKDRDEQLLVIPDKLAEDQHKKSLEFLAKLFELLDSKAKERFEVLLSNYMPRFRTIVVDDERIYLYHYMYGTNVSDYPDHVLDKSGVALATQDKTKNSVFTRVLASTHNLVNAPEIIPYIRFGRIYEYWEESKLAEWDSWDPKVRKRHEIVHQYYVLHAEGFHQKFGDEPEDYVQKHLNLLGGRTIVLGCGSGKEVKYLFEQRKCSELYGIDFSHEAINLAIKEMREGYPNSITRFIVADFYDLEHIIKGEFDSIVANAAFVHLLERGHMSKILRSIWRKLRPGGLCFIRNLYEEKNGTPIVEQTFRSKDRFKDPRWFVYYSRAYLAELARKEGFFIDDDATKKICIECGYGDLDAVMMKGVRHHQFGDTTKWPTILLEKPQFLTAIMTKRVDQNLTTSSWTGFSEMAEQERADCLKACAELTGAIYEGLNVEREIRAVVEQKLGETVLVWDDSRLAGFAVCHCGAGTEAGSGALYIKFGAARPGHASERFFNRLLEACEAFAASRGLEKLVTGVNTARIAAYRQMLARGFQSFIQGVALQRSEDQGYNRPYVYVIDDWR